MLALQGSNPLRGCPRSSLRAFARLAASSDAAPPVVPLRKSKSAGKRHALGLQGLAVQLCSLTNRQLQKMTPLLDDGHMEAIRIAQTLPRRNQGRKRQEALIGKLLNSLEEDEQAALQAALRHAQHKRGTALPQPDVLAQEWHAAILAGDEAALPGITELAVQQQGLQQLLQLVRRCRAAVAMGEQPPQKVTQQLLQLLREISRAQPAQSNTTD